MRALAVAALAVLLSVATAEVSAQEAPTTTVQVRVWQDTLLEQRLWVSARPEGGSWRTLGTFPLALDDGFRFSSRYRYGDFAVEPPSGLEDGRTVEVRVLQAVDDPTVILVGAREAPTSWLRVGTVELPLDDGFSPRGHSRYGDITIDVPRADASVRAACSNGIAVPDPGFNAGLVGDCVTLLEAHDILVGDDGAPLPSWTVDRPVADWTGVTVSREPPRVTEITLSEVLHGQVPPGLARLERLRTLQLYNTPLTGEIPRELGLLAHLEVLNLTRTDLRGRIPPELDQLWTLWYLQLLDNQIEGEIPRELAGLPDLWVVDLRGNRLTGAIPVEFGRPNLNVLMLGGNRLTGAIPAELGSAVHLEQLGLGGNMLTGAIPPELGALTGLHFLFLSSNQLTGGIPAELGNLTELWELYLRNNQLTGEIPPQVAALPNLNHISFFNNPLSGCVPVALWDKVSTIQLPWCDAVQVLVPVPPLDGAVVAACAGDGAVPDAEENPDLVNDCAALLAARAVLDPGGAVLNWSAETPIQDWTGVGVRPGRVEHLWLSGEGLAGQIPAVLANLTHLDQLSLGHNALTGPIPPELVHLEQLRYLWLDNNQLTGPIPAELGAFAALRHLSLSGNQLSGPIPPALGQIERLLALDLADNQLTGEIPWELARLGEVFLDLRGNQLTGSIPQEFAEILSIGNLRLWLSGNALSGCVPLALAPALKDRDQLGLAYCACPASRPASSWSTPDLKVGADGIPFMPHGPNQVPGTYRITFQLVVDVPHGGEWSLGERYRDDDGRIRVRITEEKSFSSLVLDPFRGEEIARAVVEGPPDCAVTIAGLFDHIAASARVAPLDLPLAPNGLPTLSPLQPVAGPGTYYIPDSSNLAVGVPPGMRLTFERGAGVCADPGGCFSLLHLRDEESGSLLVIHSRTGEETSRELTADAGSRDVRALLDAVAASIRTETPPYLPASCDDAPTAADCAALLVAVETLDVNDALNWSAQGALSGWDGVTVDPWTGRVVMVDVGRWELGGEIPAALSQLTALQVLRLDGNQLSGPIPPELGRLSHLRELNLGPNDLSGAIPGELGALTNLEELNLYDNDLSGEIPAELGNLPRLRVLILYANRLEGCIPTSLERFDIVVHSYSNPHLKRCPDGP